VTVPCIAPRAGGAGGVIGFPCHAHDNDNVKKWGPYTAHVSTYMGRKELRPLTQGLSKPGPGDRSPQEIGFDWSLAGT